MVGYPVQGKIKAAGTDLPISTKTSKIICKKIRNMKYDRADRFLEGLTEGTENINGKQYTKTAIYIRDVLNSAKNNAVSMGVENDLKIMIAVAEKGAKRARGKRRRDFGVEMKNTHIKIILEELKEKSKKKSKKTDKPSEQVKEAVKEEVKSLESEVNTATKPKETKAEKPKAVKKETKPKTKKTDKKEKTEKKPSKKSTPKKVAKKPSKKK